MSEFFRPENTKYRNLRTSPKRLWLSERFEVTAVITDRLVAWRKLLTQRSVRSESPKGRVLKQPAALSDSLERISHSAALSFAHQAVSAAAEKVLDLFAGSLIIIVVIIFIHDPDDLAIDLNSVTV